MFVVMGVCGCGKTAVCTALKHEIESRFRETILVSFLEGDDLHPATNKNKMKRGIPLNDKDRIPWLLSIRKEIDRHQPLLIRRDQHELRQFRHILLIACSALKFSYREILRSSEPNRVSFIMLDGPRKVLEQRVNDRVHEFMPSSLLQSNLDALEFPNSEYIEHDVVIQSFEPSLCAIAQRLVDGLVVTHKLFTVRFLMMTW